MILPYIFPKFSGKRDKIYLTVICVLTVGFICFFRIVAGAHFFSDVLVGGTISFFSAYASGYIVSVFVKKFPIFDVDSQTK
ncbi:MAG: phosphatase PAP2 family protein, partial [Clostridia bacterium]|nr:phosphatase PAP2 family protein [Clostridia bacterium]